MSATGTVRLHRVLKAPPQRIYKAFLDPAAMAKWLPPHGFTGTGPRDGCPRRRLVQDVVHELRHGQKPLVRRHLRRADAATSASATSTNSTIRTCPAKCTSPSRSARSPAARNCPSSRKASPPPSPPNSATSAGRNRSRFWPTSSNPKFPTERNRNHLRSFRRGACTALQGGELRSPNPCLPQSQSAPAAPAWACLSRPSDPLLANSCGWLS